MSELLTNESVISVLIQMPFVFVMGVIMLGMRADLQALRQDFKECVNHQQELITQLVKSRLNVND